MIEKYMGLYLEPIITEYIDGHKQKIEEVIQKRIDTVLPPESLTEENVMKSIDAQINLLAELRRQKGEKDGGQS